MRNENNISRYSNLLKNLEDKSEYLNINLKHQENYFRNFGESIIQYLYTESFNHKILEKPNNLIEFIAPLSDSPDNTSLSQVDNSKLFNRNEKTKENKRNTKLLNINDSYRDSSSDNIEDSSDDEFLEKNKTKIEKVSQKMKSENVPKVFIDLDNYIKITNSVLKLNGYNYYKNYNSLLLKYSPEAAMSENLNIPAYQFKFFNLINCLLCFKKRPCSQIGICKDCFYLFEEKTESELLDMNKRGSISFDTLIEKGYFSKFSFGWKVKETIKNGELNINSLNDDNDVLFEKKKLYNMMKTKMPFINTFPEDLHNPQPPLNQVSKCEESDNNKYNFFNIVDGKLENNLLNNNVNVSFDNKNDKFMNDKNKLETTDLLTNKNSDKPEVGFKSINSNKNSENLFIKNIDLVKIPNFESKIPKPDDLSVTTLANIIVKNNKTMNKNKNLKKEQIEYSVRIVSKL